MMDARKLLINLLYLSSAQSNEVPGWSHRETKKGSSAYAASAGSFFFQEHPELMASRE
ncbi:hypothetical protein YS110_01685 [Acidovorax sp. YS12]|jgi:hypothetical protein|nr:hypothetical protein YS110_01685 [Acidovorax sp. YS12]